MTSIIRDSYWWLQENQGCYPTWTEKLSKENWYSTSFLTDLDVHFMACHHRSNNLYIWIKLVKYNPANTRFWLKACTTAQNATDTMLASRRALRFLILLVLCCPLEILHFHSRKYCGFFCNFAFTIYFNLQNIPWLHAFSLKTHNSEPCCLSGKSKFILFCLH